MALSFRTRPKSPTANPSHQEASIASYPYPSEGRQKENLKHRKLTKLITWITVLSNSMKLWAMPCRATQDRRIMVESSHKMWSTGKGSGRPLPYSCLENSMNSMKRQKDRTLKDELPRALGAQYTMEKSREIDSEGWRSWAKAKTIPSCECDWW